MGNRSIFYPSSSAGNTITFNVVEDTGWNLTSNVSFIKMLARASLKTYLPGSPGIENEAGRSAYGRTRYRRPKYPAVQRGGGVRRITLGWVLDPSFTPIAQ